MKRYLLFIIILISIAIFAIPSESLADLVDQFQYLDHTGNVTFTLYNPASVYPSVQYVTAMIYRFTYPQKDAPGQISVFANSFYVSRSRKQFLIHT